MLPGRRFAAIGFLVCLQSACASSARTPPPGATASPEAPAVPAPIVADEVAPPVADAPATAVTEADPGACAVIGASGEPVTTVALDDPIDPSHAPRPSNESERLLFRQLYETLIGADCTGRAVPGLAATWTLDGDGRTWIVTLRDDARFSDGTPVTTSDVRASWLRLGSDDVLHPSVSRLVESIVPLTDRTLGIRLLGGRADTPLALAHPDLAVARRIADSSWPLGTRAARIAPGAGAVPAVASSAITLRRDDGFLIQFLVARGDLRDLLDHRVDMLLTRDRATLDYAATLPRFEAVPLAWQHTHVLLAPGRSRTAPSLSDEARQVLAADAVRGEARGAQGPFWWESWASCGLAASPPGRSQSSPIPRVVYDATDGVARDLAERFVGLTRAPGAAATAVLDLIAPDHPRRTFERATGLTGAALTVAQRRGADSGYIVSLDKRSPAPCRELHVLLERAPWLDPDTIVPLVETRRRAIVRRGVAGITAEWDGGLLIAAPNAR